jgi:hypothetical protein
VPTRVSRNAENTLVVSHLGRGQLGEGVSVAILRWTWRQWLREFGVRDDAPFHRCCRGLEGNRQAVKEQLILEGRTYSS